MLQFSKKLFYAVEAVLYIAYNAASEPVSSKEIACKQGMLPRYLEQMMQKMVKAGILRGVRGPHGGYLLAREKRRISLEDIYNALDEHDPIPSSTPLGNNIIIPLIKKNQTALMEQLQQITIAHLYEQALARNIRKTADEHNDFAI
jgi:Rrf2 family iron-sulfur cluster assembly transcriptional regulator